MGKFNESAVEPVGRSAEVVGDGWEIVGEGGASNVRVAISDDEGGTSDVRGAISDGEGAVSNVRLAIRDGEGGISVVRVAISDGKGGVSDVRVAISDGKGGTSDVRVDIIDGEGEVTHEKDGPPVGKPDSYEQDVGGGDDHSTPGIVEHTQRVQPKTILVFEKISKYFLIFFLKHETFY